MIKRYAHELLAVMLITLLTVVAEAEGTPTAIWLLETGLALAVFITGLER